MLETKEVDAVSMYTTGEVAKLCDVTVRTVQYYDTRGILTPSEISEGGRRLYSEDDLKRMRLICYLRNLGIPIKTIGELLNEKDPGNLILMILEQQEQSLEKEIQEQSEQLNQLKGLIKELKNVDTLSVESIHDAADIMSSKEKLKQIHTTVVAAGLPLSVFQWVALYYGFFKGVWWMLGVWFLASIPFAVMVLRYYYRRVSYICPHCHTVFKPTKKEMIFANHTPYTRKLTCPNCNVHGFCVEIADKEELSHA